MQTQDHNLQVLTKTNPLPATLKAALTAGPARG